MRDATVRLVDENAAGGKVREIFDDIKRTKNIEFVPNFWRALASYPDQLELVWRQLKTLMHPEAAGRKSQLDPKVRKPEIAQSYVKALIESKADVNLRDKKEKLTPLAWAKKRGDQEVIDMLVKAGAKE